MLKLLEAKYDGLESPFTRIKVKIDIDGGIMEGFLLFENDGRDFLTGGGLQQDDILRNLEDLYNDESMKLLTPVLKLGREAYDNEDVG